jgi:hypothetical protein
LIKQAVESISQRQSSSPRTILGFLLGMYGALIGGSAAVIIGLVASSSDEYIPFVLAFAALVTLALGCAVIIIAWKDPSRLMLGQVTASEYATIRRLHLGDDKQGEHVGRVVGTTLLDEERTSSDEESLTGETNALPGPADRDEPRTDRHG